MISVESEDYIHTQLDCEVGPMNFKAVYPGSFDPFTRGHMDIVQRAAALFDELHVLVAYNEQKDYLFSGDQRLELVERSVAGLDGNLTVRLNEGLTDEYIGQHDVDVLVRGLRNGDDLRYEMELEEYFQETTDAEVVYLTPSSEHLKTSSTVVRRFVKAGHLPKVEEYVHPDAFERIRELVG
jgi:pantetheine-phosphate adenylyltransferase